MLWVTAHAVGVVAIGETLRAPAMVWLLVAAVAATIGLAAATVLLRQGRSRPRELRFVGALLLAAAVLATTPLVRLAAHDDTHWERVASLHSEEAARVVVERLESVRAAAEARAREALVASSLEGAARPIVVADAVLETAVARWQDGALLLWDGEVPGPERVDAVDRPLLVDYGYRRYLEVQVAGDDGVRATCDVALGVSDALFPRLGVDLSPGARLAPDFAVGVTLHPNAPDDPRAAVLTGVPADDPWAWITVDAPRLADLRRRAMEDAGRRVALLVLLSLAPLVLVAWNAWPGRALGLRGGLLTAAVALGALGLRASLERGRVLDLLFAGADGSLALLVLPTYFASAAGGGLLRSTAEFLVTGAWWAASIVLLLPAWRGLTGAAWNGLGRLSTGLFLVVATFGQAVGTRALQELVVDNANPLLVGVDSPFFTVPFVALHSAMLLTLLPTALALVVGWKRWFRPDALGWGSIAVAVVGAMFHAGAQPTSVAPWAAVLPLLGLAARRALVAPSFSRRVLAGLLVLIWFAGIQSSGLGAVYTDEKEQVALQEAEQRLDPRDNWRRFLLDDLLREIADDRLLLQTLADRRADRSNQAFEIWARTLLPSQNFGCRVSLRDAEGRLLSEFDVGLPYEPAAQRAWSRSAPMRTRPIHVDALELVTEQGPFLVYRGRLDLSFLVPDGDASRLTVDLPYAAAEGAIPLERNVPVGLRLLGQRPAQDLAPRQTFDAAIAIGYPREGRVVKSSAPALVGLELDELPSPGTWSLRELDGTRLHVARVGDGTRELVVAFEDPSAVQRLLDTSRLAGLYLIAAAVGLLVFVGARLLRSRSESVWPTALGSFGFEERLLGSMLLIVLLPVVLVGVTQERRGVEAARAENLVEVGERLDTALQLLASGLDELAAALIRGEYVQQLIRDGDTAAARDLGPFAAAQVMVFDPTGDLVLDETLSDRDPEAARAFLDEVRGGELLLEVDAFGWFLGRSYPVVGPRGRDHTVYVRRALTDEDLGRVARTVQADLTVYDGQWAVVSSEAYMYRAGLRSPVLGAAAVPVLEGGARRVAEAERLGGLAVARGYAVLAGPGQAQRGVLSARLFAQATEAARDQRRTQMFVFGLSSLAMVLAVGAGLALSSRIVGPIRALVAATDRIARGQLDLRVAESGRDEIGQLERSFNRMTDGLAQSQAQLAARRSFLETVFGSLAAGVLVLDEEAEILEANAAAGRLLESQTEDFVGRVRTLGPPPAPTDTEIVLPRDEGPRTLRTVISPARLESGAAGWLVVFDDVTELLAGRRLALYAQMARQVAHEVKNPLTPIQLSAQLVRQAVEDGHPRVEELVAENTRTIESQVERLRNIASEFAVLGRESLDDLGPTEIGPLLQEVVGLYPRIEGSSMVELDLDDPGTALASPDGLHKVLVNLIENARQAADGRGTVRIRADRVDGRVRIRVDDEGPGISPEVQSRLFEPYFSTKSTGTGLGLVICRSLMEKMGGTIALRNRPDGVGAVAELGLSAAVRGGGNESPPAA